MKLGLQINQFAWGGGAVRMGESLAAIARAADAAGFALIGVADHLWQGPYFGGPEQPELESCVALGVVAANTSRAKLTHMVAGVHFRTPAVLAKAVTTLDVLSGGRAWLGIGAGWYEDEAIGMGIAFPLVAERFEMLEETIQICLRLWSGEHGDERPFVGKHYQLERPLNLPQSLTRPHPPIMIAGEGEQKTLRLVARYGDACSLSPGPQIARKLDVLRRHCEAEGRDYDAIEKTCAFRFDVGADRGKTGELIAKLRGLAELGIETVIGDMPDIDRIAPIKIVGREVIPAVADF